MSFIYAEKNYIQCLDQRFPVTHIYSDTRLVIDEASGLNWKPSTLSIVKKYGIIKSIILSPRCCISFAGNNIAYAHQLLEQLYAWQSFTGEQLIDLAYQIHKSAPVDDIEFLICLADENDETHIICIKNNAIEAEKISAWIGSKQAFDAMQKMRIGKLEEGEESVISFSHQAFKQALIESGDDSVGGFDIMIVYDRDEHSFFYTERLEMFCERAQKVEPGKAVRLSGAAEEGACTLHYYRSAGAVVIDIEQADLTLAYTRGQCTDADLRYKYFLLPMLIRTSTQRTL